MITKYNPEVIDSLLKEIDSNKVIQIKIWKDISSHTYTVMYLTLEDIIKDRDALTKAEMCLDTTNALTNLEKIRNLLNEFKKAMENDAVNNFMIDFSCYKRTIPRFTYSMAFTGGVKTLSQVRNGTETDVEANREDEMHAKLSALSDDAVVPGIYVKTALQRGKHKYTTATVRDIKAQLASL